MTTFRTSNASRDDSTSSSLATTVTVTAGDVVAVWNKFEGLPTTISTSDGVDSALAGTLQSHSNNDLHGQWHYFLASRGGALTITSTWASARPFKRLHVLAFNPAGGTATFDTEAINQGASTAPSSGTFTTTGTDEIALGGYGEYGPDVVTSPQINGVAADGSIINNPAGSLTASWYRLLTSTVAGGAATVSKTGVDPWIVNALAIKVTAAGGGSSPSTGLWPRPMMQNIPTDARYRAMRTMAAYSTTNPSAPAIATIYCRRTLDLGSVSGVGSRRAVH